MILYVALLIMLLIGVVSCSLPTGTKKAHARSQEKYTGAKTVLHGQATLENQSYDDLFVNGNADFKNIIVTSNANINGKLVANDCDFKTLKINGTGVINTSTIGEMADINGSVEFNNVTIDGLLKAHGNFTGQDCKFSDIKIGTRELVLRNSKTKTITVLEVQSNWSFLLWSGKSSVQQVVHLYDTIVDGNIVFEHAGGKVYLHGNSRVTGTISN